MIGATLLGPRDDGGFATYPPDHDYWYSPRGAPTVSGVEVSEELAMTFSTVFACVNKLSKTLATLPVHVFLDLPDGRRQNMPKHPVRRMFNVRFNDEALATPTRWAMYVNLLLWGNAYFEVLRNQITGEPMAMRLLYSRYMTVERDKQTMRLVYRYREPGQPPVDLPPERVLHIAGLSYNGLVGLSTVGFARETFGLGIGTTEYRAAFLGNGAPTGMVLERPVDAPSLSGPAGENLVNDFDDRHRGSGKAFRTALLREGMTLKTIGMPMKDAQFVEQVQLTDRQVYGIFDVQPPKVQDYTRATYDNLEQANMDWKTDSLIPWCVLTENAANATLLTEPHYLKHNLDGLARGDIKSRYEAYSRGRQNGILATNDCRRPEDLEPVDGGDDDFWQPRNMVTKAQLAEESAQRNRANDHLEAMRRGIDEQGDNAQTLAEIKAGMAAGQSAMGTLMADTAEATQERDEAFIGSIDCVSGDMKDIGKLVEETGQQHSKQVKQLGENLVEQNQKLVVGFLGVAKTVDTLREQADEKQHAELSSLLLDPATRAVTKETKAIASAEKRYQKALDADGILAWVDKFYTDHQAQLYEMFRATTAYTARQLSLSEPEAHAALEEFCEHDATVSSAAIRSACLSSQSPDEVLRELDRWKAEKPAAMVRLLMGRLCGEQGDRVKG